MNRMFIIYYHNNSLLQYKVKINCWSIKVILIHKTLEVNNKMNTFYF